MEKICDKFYFKILTCHSTREDNSRLILICGFCIAFSGYVPPDQKCQLFLAGLDESIFEGWTPTTKSLSTIFLLSIPLNAFILSVIHNNCSSFQCILSDIYLLSSRQIWKTDVRICFYIVFSLPYCAVIKKSIGFQIMTRCI